MVETTHKELTKLKKSQLIDQILLLEKQLRHSLASNELLIKTNINLTSEGAVKDQQIEELRALASILDTGSRNFRQILLSLMSMLKSTDLVVGAFDENIHIYNKHFGKNNERSQLIQQIIDELNENGLGEEGYFDDTIDQ
jgi:regulator of replication initiation timing